MSPSSSTHASSRTLSLTIDPIYPSTTRLSSNKSRVASISLSSSRPVDIPFRVDTQHERDVKVVLQNVNVPYLVTHGKMPRYITAESTSDEHYGLIRLQIQNVYPMRERYSMGVRFVSAKKEFMALSDVALIVERRKVIGDVDEAWVPLPHQHTSNGTLTVTRLIEDKTHQDEQIRFVVMRDDEELGSVTGVRGSQRSGIFWKDMRAPLELELSDALQCEIGAQYLEIHHVEKRDMMPFTRYFQSGARLALNFAVDCSSDSSSTQTPLTDRLSQYTTIINSILHQFIPYTSANDRIDVEAFGTRNESAMHLASTSVEEWDSDLQLNASKNLRSAEWRTFSAVLEHAVDKCAKYAKASSRAVPDYSVLFILTQGGECRLRKAYTQLVKASHMPMSVIFVGVDAQAEECVLLQEACKEGTHMSEEGDFPLKTRDFCSYIPATNEEEDEPTNSHEANRDEEETQQSTTNSVLQRNLFHTILSHIENYMDVFDLNPQPESAHNKEYNDRMDELKSCLRLVKPKRVESPAPVVPSTQPPQQQPSEDSSAVNAQGSTINMMRIPPPTQSPDILQHMQHQMFMHNMGPMHMGPQSGYPMHQMPPHHQMMYHPQHHHQNGGMHPQWNPQMMPPPPQMPPHNAPPPNSSFQMPPPMHHQAPPNANFAPPPHTNTPPPHSFFHYQHFMAPSMHGNQDGGSNVMSPSQDSQQDQQPQQQQHQDMQHQHHHVLPPHQQQGMQQQPFDGGFQHHPQYFQQHQQPFFPQQPMMFPPHGGFQQHHEQNMTEQQNRQ